MTPLAFFSIFGAVLAAADPSEAPAGYGQEPVFDTPATGQIDQPVSAGYGNGVPTATPVASAPPVEQSSGWTWSKATPAQQANRFNM